MAAARQLFVTKGYHDTRPQDIAKAAGVGHGTFYLHFADKRDCFLAFVDEAGQQLENAINEGLKGDLDFLQQIRAILGAIDQYAQENPGVLLAAMTDTEVIGHSDGAPRETLMERWGKQWATRLRIQADQGLVDRSYDVDIIGSSLGGLIREATLSANRKRLEREELISHLSEFIVRGLSPRT